MRLRWRLGRCPWCWRRSAQVAIVSTVDDAVKIIIHVPHCYNHETEADDYAQMTLDKRYKES